MQPRSSAAFPVVMAILLGSAAPHVQAQADDDVLPIEKATARRDRDRIAALLRQTRLDFRALEMTPRELCRHLSALTGDKVPFLWMDRSGAAVVPPISLERKATSLLSAMAVLQTQTGLRFVFRDGVVALSPADQVAPHTELRVYNLRSAVTPLRSFPGPKLGLRGPGDEGSVLFPPEEDSGTTVSGFTADGIERLITENVTPELWGTRATLTNSNGLFLIRHTAAGHRQVRELLEQVGVVPALR